MSLTAACSYAQNDLDAIRYSRIGIGGSARVISMGGAFGAIGADLSNAAYNPAGLGLFRKGDLAFSAGFRSTNNTGTIYKKTTPVFDVNLVFNNFGIAAAIPANNDPDSRHVIAFSNTQLQNFNNSTRMTGYTNSSSLAKDMLLIANTKKNPGSLNPNYEGLGFDTYLLDTIGANFISLLDTKRTIKQTRDIITSGRVNDINLSYAYSYKDNYYFGASVGFPQVKYESTTTHVESDDNDSIRIGMTSPNSYTHTFIDGFPVFHDYYLTRLAFNELTYTEYFKTTGSGVNLKIGGIARLGDAFRVGFHYHTPTFYRLNDSYSTSMSVAFDAQPENPDELTDPEEGGYFKYRIITPSRFGVNAAYIYKKKMVIGMDYEFVNYKAAKLGSTNVSDFAGVNAVIRDKYKGGHNLSVGAEFNFNPIMVRAGYNMQGSPFGEVFTDDFVRNTFSAGIGFRTKSSFYFDFVVSKSYSSENYFLFSELNTQARLNYNTTLASATIGIKF
jgi:hypothetical protein